jgi:arsenate reductase
MNESKETVMEQVKVLFVCIHNSARSQMAEALLKKIGGARFDVESAGLEPGQLNPLAVAAMKDVGLDISLNKTKRVFDFIKQGKPFHYVITVCDETSAERCPVFPGVTKRIHWSFLDPSSFEGDQQEKLKKTIDVRNQIEKRIKDFVLSLSPASSS